MLSQWKKSQTLAMGMILMLVGCANDVAVESEDVPAVNADIEALSLPQLARHYLLDEVSPAEGRQVLERIRGLSPSDARTFSLELRALQQPYSGADDQFAGGDFQDRIEKYSLKLGVNRFSFLGDKNFLENALGGKLEEDVVDNVVPRNDGVGVQIQAACSVGYVSCNWTSVWPVSMNGVSCAPGTCSTNGISNDRMSNSACELGACDHRIFYTIASQPHSIAGLTTSSQCVVSYYSPNILSAYASGTGYALFGVAGPAACGIGASVGSYLQANTRVYP